MRYVWKTLGIGCLAVLLLAAPARADDTDARIERLQQALVEVEAQLAKMRELYTQEHPRLRALQGQYEVLTTQLEALRKVRDGKRAADEIEAVNAEKVDEAQDVHRRIAEHRQRIDALEEKLRERPGDAGLTAQMVAARRQLATLEAALARSRVLELERSAGRSVLRTEAAKAEKEGRRRLFEMERARAFLGEGFRLAEAGRKFEEAKQARRALEEAKARIDAQKAAVDSLANVTQLLEKGDLEGVRKAKDQLAVATAALKALGAGRERVGLDLLLPADGREAEERPEPWPVRLDLPGPSPAEARRRAHLLRAAGGQAEAPDAAKRLDHLKAAWKHLREAGAHEQAEAVGRQIRELEHQLQRSAGTAAVLGALRSLRSEVHHLRSEVREIKALLQKRAR